MPSNSLFQAANSVGSLTQAQVTDYDRKFIKNLKGKTPFVNCTDKRWQSAHSGNTRSLFMYVPLAGDAQQQVDGVLESPISVTVNSNSLTLGEFGDYTTFSAFALTAALDDPMVSTSKEMSYRAAQSLNTLVRNTADNLFTIDASVRLQITSGAALDLGTVRAQKQSLVGRAVQSVKNGMFCGVIHPFILGDLWNGTTINNSAVDFWKYTPEGQEKYNALAGADQDKAIELPGTGIEFYQSQFVKQTPNLFASSTGLRTYIFGEEAIVSVFLKVPGDTDISNGEWRTINAYTQAFSPSAFDPEGTIGGGVSYRFHYAASAPPDTTMRARTIDSVSAVS